MAHEDGRFPFRRAARVFQDNIGRSGAAAAYTLVGAILMLGGLGYLADQWSGTGPWLAVTGLLLGVVVGFYELIKTARPR